MKVEGGGDYIGAFVAAARYTAPSGPHRNSFNPSQVMRRLHRQRGGRRKRKGPLLPDGKISLPIILRCRVGRPRQASCRNLKRSREKGKKSRTSSYTLFVLLGAVRNLLDTPHRQGGTGIREGGGNSLRPNRTKLLIARSVPEEVFERGKGRGGKRSHNGCFDQGGLMNLRGVHTVYLLPLTDPESDRKERRRGKEKEIPHL